MQLVRNVIWTYSVVVIDPLEGHNHIDEQYQCELYVEDNPLCLVVVG